MANYNGYTNGNNQNPKQFVPNNNNTENAQEFSNQPREPYINRGYSNQQSPDMNYSNSGQQSGDEPGKGAAIASLVLGIVSIVCWFLGIGAFVGLITGIIGIICASSSKKAGYTGGIQTGGLVCSIIGVVVSAVIFVTCVACVGVLGTAGALFD
ncbi:hypothetical protein [Butyrivibrio sp. YAB3001]|uniref:hypothetical protein n=1 Tax=Butyrivibrio sp. YAB3001 TaxID=1520812 RepID=UPI0008F654DE|nr:hypothetical protein [Butyrivibrio sp. YAB3001]SFD09773.1 hypothetical protein SAMN02910398_04044 [Butyrivibrio sp. YAB3001]